MLSTDPVANIYIDLPMKRLAKAALVSTTLFTGLSLATFPALAHVVVTPNSVGVAKFQTFDMGVPTEKDNPTVALKLLIPDGLKEVTPNVKSGWTITEKKTGDGDTAVVTEIDWTGGSIPPDQRDDFLFNAQVPSTATTIKWKAYQTYKDGSVVNWDADPSTIAKGEEGTPYSTTTVVNDLASIGSSTDNRTWLQRFLDDQTTPLVASAAALALSLAAIVLSLVRRSSSM